MSPAQTPSRPPRPKKIPYNKPPIDFSAQVQKMAGRGLVIPDPAKAEFYLGQLNYYRLAAYCLPFEQDHGNHQFIAGTSFDDVLNLYIFDRELRLLVLDAIERFEVSLRTQLAYHLSHQYQTAHPHLKPEIFDNPVIYGATLNKLDGDIKRSREEFIKHLNGKYEELMPPIWAVVELMTMGQLSKWFSNIKLRADRQRVSRVYGLDEKIMTSFCEHLALVRNHAAHHARLWNRDFTKTPKLPKKGQADLTATLFALPDTDRRLRKLYNTFVMLAYLMEKISDQPHWKNNLIQLIDQRQIAVSKMGFPADWKQRPIWQ